MTIIPLSKNTVMSMLHAIAGSIKTRSDYKDNCYKLVIELLELVEDHNKDE